ncbi:hypothetical protein WL71_13195 [Burkholderia ubonensis]|nr:hypothetical protein WL71_13195 [Burkholderia ubonensis]KWD88071.1 hypothetical protein WL70_00445 [Burkholderia ubonensis]KWD91423.1 hypothetical protein WL72_30260 [Burkholderia ubonensis]
MTNGFPIDGNLGGQVGLLLRLALLRQVVGCYLLKLPFLMLQQGVEHSMPGAELMQQPALADTTFT